MSDSTVGPRAEDAPSPEEVEPSTPTLTELSYRRLFRPLSAWQKVAQYRVPVERRAEVLLVEHVPAPTHAFGAPCLLCDATPCICGRAL